MKTIKKYCKLISFLASRRNNVIAAFTVALIVYFLMFFIRGEFFHVLWIPYWVSMGSLGFIVSFLLWRTRQKRLMRSLIHSLDGRTEKTYKVYATNGGFIGEITHDQYLTAEYFAKTDKSVFVMQCLNFLWVGYCLLSKTLFVMPVTTFMVALFVSFMHIYLPGEVFDKSLLDVTVLDIITSPFLFYMFGLSSFAVFFSSIFTHSFPGFRDMFAMRLTRILSRDLPNLIHCDSWYTTSLDRKRLAG